MITVNYYLREKNKKGETPINLFVSYKGKRKKFPTGFKADPKNWNEGSQRLRLKKGDKIREDINDKLDHWRDMIRVAVNKIRSHGESDYHFDSVHELISKILSEDSANTLNVSDDLKKEISFDKKLSFFKAFDEFIDESEKGFRLNDKGKKIGKESIQKYRRTKQILQEFSRHYPTTFESINLDFYRSFINFLNAYKVKERAKEELEKDPSLDKYVIGFKINTIGKFIRTIKAFMSYATEKGWNENLAYTSKKFKAFNVDVDNISLSEAEVNEIQKLDMSDTPELDLSRDLFVLGCWTGLRFENLTKVKNEYINDGMLTFPSISKSDQRITIPLNESVLGILEKHGGKWPSKVSSGNFNKNLKKIAEMIPSLHQWFVRSTTQGGVELEEKFTKYELVTAHTSRRTFATIYYLKGVPIQLIMKITGHKKESTFLKYINVSPEEHADKFKSYFTI